MLGEDEVDGAADRGVGEFRKRLRHRLHVPHAADIGERDEERVRRAVAAKGAHDLLAARRAVPEGAVEVALALADRAVGFFGRFGDEVGKPRRIGDGEPPEEGRVVGEREEKIAQLSFGERRTERRRRRLLLDAQDEIRKRRLRPARVGKGRRRNDAFEKRS